MRRFLLSTALGVLLAGLSAAAQGTVSYSLPRTALTLTVTVERESFFAGPYARYAQKYLGISAAQADAVRYEILDMRLTPSLEADPAARFTVSARAAEKLLQLTAQGLVSTGLGETTESTAWHFDGKGGKDFSSRGVSSNLTSVTTTLYKREKNDTSFNRVAVHQSRVVSKPLDQRAEEAAEKLLELRETRLDILSGSTDGDFSGEALGAAVREIAALEDEYLSLFTGYSVRERQTLSFDLIPSGGAKRSVQVAFRLSEEDGLLSADNLSGQPFTIEYEPEARAEDETPDPKFKGEYIRYRIPAVCRIRISDGVKTYLTARVPIAQKGYTALIPLGK